MSALGDVVEFIGFTVGALAGGLCSAAERLRSRRATPGACPAPVGSEGAPGAPPGATKGAVSGRSRPASVQNKR